MLAPLFFTQPVLSGKINDPLRYSTYGVWHQIVFDSSTNAICISHSHDMLLFHAKQFVQI